MATITFKAKPHNRQRFLDNGTVDPVMRTTVNIPQIKRSHCNMSEFRSHKKIGPFANSDMFLGMVAREIKPLGTWIDCNDPPANVTVNQSGFLAVISINIP